MVSPACRLQGCARPVVARGLCKAHYLPERQRERDADPRAPRCTVPACGKAQMSRGMCQRHYMRVRYAERDHDPDVPRCVQAGCSRAARAKGYCGAHYHEALRAGSVGDPCGVEGCASSAASRGLCSRHARRARKYGLTAAQLGRFDGDCEACGRPADVVDHDHATGRVRGPLCDRCNHAIGHAGDSAELLRALAAYLETHDTEEPTP